MPLLPAPEPVLLLPAPESRWKRRAKPVIVAALAALLLVAFAIGWFIHHRRASQAEQANQDEQDALAIASVAQVRRSPAVADVLLPGSLAPIAEASIYARASGYLRRRHVDLGDSVRAGQVLAEIDSPELDQSVAQAEAATGQARQQLAQAEAAVGDARARLELARVTVDRYELLLRQDSIAAQDVDQQRQVYDSARAALASARSNVGAAAENVRAAVANARRAAALQAFKTVRAPFDGVVTARNVDVGALVGSSGGPTSSSAGGASPTGSPSATTSSSGSATAPQPSATSMSSGSGGASVELFRIASVDRLRVYVNVPQQNATAVAVGSDATVYLQEFAQPVHGRVARTARAIDSLSRTLLTEVQIDNAAGTLLPGMYAQVRLTSPRSNPPLLVPGEAVIARGAGTSVATLAPPSDDQQRRIAHEQDRGCARAVRVLPVVVGRDYGTEVEITRGLGNDAFVVVSPGDRTTDGAVVLPELQTKQGDGNAKPGGDKGAAKADAKGDGSQSEKGAGVARERRQRLRRTCLDEQVRQQQAEAPRPKASEAPAGQSVSSLPGGPSDREPQSIQSPSMQAPTQGRSGRGR